MRNKMDLTRFDFYTHEVDWGRGDGLTINIVCQCEEGLLFGTGSTLDDVFGWAVEHLVTCDLKVDHSRRYCSDCRKRRSPKHFRHELDNLCRACVARPGI